MFFIEAPARRDNAPAHAYEVTVPTYQSFEAKLGEQVATIHSGTSALTLWTVTGVRLSDEPAQDDEPRGLIDGWVYADGDLGDRIAVTNDEHGTEYILPYMLMSVYGPSDE